MFINKKIFNRLEQSSVIILYKCPKELVKVHEETKEEVYGIPYVNPIRHNPRSKEHS